MKKLDGRSKKARALKAQNEVEQYEIHPGDWLVTAGGTGHFGDQYAPLELEPPASAMQTQCGGDHYKKMAIQPMEFSFRNKLDPAQHTAIKYITRFRDKGGRIDLEKAKHVIDMLIELEYGS